MFRSEVSRSRWPKWPSSPNCGAAIDSPFILERSDRLDEAWFGETASEIIVAIDASSRDRLQTALDDNEVPYSFIGTTGGASLDLGSCHF